MTACSGFMRKWIERVGAAELALYLYNFPKMSQVPLSVALLERLVQHYPQTVAGIKDSSGDWPRLQTLLARQWPEFRVFCSSESLLLQTLRAGGAGCISATVNVNPAAIVQLYRTWSEGAGGSSASDGSSSSADTQQRQLARIREIFQARPMIAAMKAVTADYYGDESWATVRPPLVAFEPRTAAGAAARTRGGGVRDGRVIVAGLVGGDDD